MTTRAPESYFWTPTRFIQLLKHFLGAYLMGVQIVKGSLNPLHSPANILSLNFKSICEYNLLKFSHEIYLKLFCISPVGNWK